MIRKIWAIFSTTHALHPSRNERDSQVCVASVLLGSSSNNNNNLSNNVMHETDLRSIVYASSASNCLTLHRNAHDGGQITLRQILLHQMMMMLMMVA